MKWLYLVVKAVVKRMAYLITDVCENLIDVEINPIYSKGIIKLLYLSMIIAEFYSL